MGWPTAIALFLSLIVAYIIQCTVQFFIDTSSFSVDEEDAIAPMYSVKDDEEKGAE